MKRSLPLVLMAFVLVLIASSSAAWARGGGGRGGARSGSTARNLRRNNKKVERMYRDRALMENRDAILRDGRVDSQ